MHLKLQSFLFAVRVFRVFKTKNNLPLYVKMFVAEHIKDVTKAIIRELPISDG